MASLPPSQVEEQTDEDFFDNLVDEDIRIKGSHTNLADSESDDFKTFANLGIGDAITVVEESGDSSISFDGVDQPKQETGPLSDSASDRDRGILVAEGNISRVSTNSIGTATETGDSLATPMAMTTTATITTITTTTIATSDVMLDSMTSKSSGSRSAGVKEVQWSAFSADSGQSGARRVVSYSDFFTGLADSSDDPFQMVENNLTADSESVGSIVGTSASDQQVSLSSSGHLGMDGQNLYSSQYWESMYPGWKHDPVTGEWSQVEDYNAVANMQQAFHDNMQSAGNAIVSDQRSDVSYLQQTTQSVTGSMLDNSMTGSISNLSASQWSSGFPANMVFDPQYPGWYYDTIKQEWFLFESYTEAVQSSNTANSQQIHEGHSSFASFSKKDNNLYGEFGQYEQYRSQEEAGQIQSGDWTGSRVNYAQLDTWQSECFAQSGSVRDVAQIGNAYGATGQANNFPGQEIDFKAQETLSMHGHPNQDYDSKNSAIGFHAFASKENLYQFNQPNAEHGQQGAFSSDYYGNQKPVDYAQPQFAHASHSQLSYTPKEGWSSAGRPAHALVTFGFGGKLLILKDTSYSYNSEGNIGWSISILNLMEIFSNKVDDGAYFGNAALDYVRALCHQSFPGPLVGGNVAAKELYRWLDERIANCHSPNMDLKNGELLRLLFSLLKISCQHYGKLRSSFGVDLVSQETDGPESAVTKLFASARRTSDQVNKYGALAQCLQNMPSDGQIKATAAEVQNLLVSGRRMEALHCAQEGQLWGPALVLAAQLGDKFYVDTVKQMAHHQFVAGSPLRTLCLLIAGQPADVFSNNSTAGANPSRTFHIPQQHTQFQGNSMLDDWEENLAIIAANRTKGDELVIIHLGDCLWKERGQIAAAHTCYLVADANFEAYSDTARMCLIGADHWKFPRTYASPEAIQRTELFEYSKVLGNSQFILLSFQPYKLIYAYMLAEVGKLNDSLKYCQAMLKTLKSSSRAPEVETLKSLISSLEERIRTHQQVGYDTNLAPAKLVGKLFTSIDRSIHRMIGAPPSPPMPEPSTSLNSFQSNQLDSHPVAPKIANSQSTMVMSSLMPSASTEWTDNSDRMSANNRSISEPDFSRSPKQIDQSKDAASSGSKASVSGGPSRFGRFGSQLLQKTMGWMSRSRTDRQAKLGERNKFYYDEKLKRWVEEGAEPPAEETALPPPPTTTSFQNSTSESNLKSRSKMEVSPPNGGMEVKGSNHLEHGSGLPPIPPSSHQISARGRIGVRSRYVDTFNKGGGTPTNLFQSPSAPATKSMNKANFFVPVPVTSANLTVEEPVESNTEPSSNDGPSTAVIEASSFSSAPSPAPLQRYPSMGSLNTLGDAVAEAASRGSTSVASHSRAASWGGSINNSANTNTSEVRSLGEALRLPAFMPNDPSSTNRNDVSITGGSGSFGDDLHEVEL